MSLARKCDRCGTYHDEKLNKLTVDSTYVMYEAEYDLCDNCYLEFKEFMRANKIKNSTELFGIKLNRKD